MIFDESNVFAIFTMELDIGAGKEVKGGLLKSALWEGT